MPSNEASTEPSPDVVARADPSESAAVLIGVGNYQSDFPTVPQAATCVDLMAERFATDLWGLRPPMRLVSLRDTDRRTMLETVGNAARLIGPNGVLTIYFVGHAERHNGQLYLAASDSDRSRPATTMISIADLVTEVDNNWPHRSGRGQRVILLLDCCFAGQAAPQLPRHAMTAAESAGWYLIGAADRNTPAEAAPGAETTLFTGALLDTLAGLTNRSRSLRGIDIFEGVAQLLSPEHQPVHNAAGWASTIPWLKNQRYQEPPRFEQHRFQTANDQVRRRPWMAPVEQPGMVARPELLAMLLEAMQEPVEASPAVAIAVRGTGGFGKTTLVTQASHHPAIAARFPGGLLWTELGQDTHGPALAAKINDLTEQLTGHRPTLSGPQDAGHRLGEALDTYPEPILLVIDDAWSDDQVRSFLNGGRRCRRLVTTRHQLLTLTAAPSVVVDAMTDDHAITALTRGLDAMPPGTLERLVRLTGRWPLLLNITNRTIVRLAREGGSIADAAATIADRLAGVGPAALDNPWAASADQRREMVAACINASLDVLPLFTRDRYLELAVFAEDADIPYHLLALLWAKTGGLDSFQTRQLGHALIDASLAAPARHQPGLRLHDVLRSYLRTIAELVLTNSALIASAAGLLPTRHIATDTAVAAGAQPWWDLPSEHEYLWRHLVEHLTSTSGKDEVDKLLCDLRWTAARIRRDGPVHAETDLRRSNNPDIVAIAEAIRLNAHLLTPTIPPQALDDILASRLDGHAQLQPLVDAFVATLTHLPRVANLWPPPDQPHPALRCPIHTGHHDGVRQVRIAPDGEWLATIGDRDPILSIWNPRTGEQIHQINTSHTHGVLQLLVAPDGTWLATIGHSTHPGDHRDPILSIWNPRTGEQIHQINTSHASGIWQALVAPNGAWLGTIGWDRRTVSIWDIASGQPIQEIEVGHRYGLQRAHPAPDGSWLATWGARSGYGEGPESVLSIWDPVTGRQAHRLPTRHEEGVRNISIAPDGSWLMTVGDRDMLSFDVDPAVEMWSPVTGRQLGQLDTGHWSGVQRLHVASNGSWAATTGFGDDRVRIWDLPNGRPTQELSTGHPDGVRLVNISPDSTWMVTTGGRGVRDSDGDPVVRVWDRVEHQNEQGKPNIIGIKQMRPAPDRSWIVTAGVGNDPVVRTWNPATGQQLLRLDTGHARGVRKICVAPNGSWLATVGYFGDNVVQVWDSKTGRRVRLLPTVHHTILKAYVAARQSWLVTTGVRGDAKVQIWEPESGQLIRQFDTGHEGGVKQALLAPDSSWLATAGMRGYDRPTSVRVWDTATGLQVQELPGGGERKLFVGPNGSWLATFGNDRPSTLSDSLLSIWNPANGEQLAQIDTGHRGGVDGLHLAPGGAWFLTVGASRSWDKPDSLIRLWDPNTGQRLRQMDTGHLNGVQQVAVAPNAAWFVTVGAQASSSAYGDPNVFVWDSATGRQIQHLHAGNFQGVQHASISHDSSTLAMFGAATAWLWNRRASELATIRIDGAVNAWNLSDDGRSVAIGGTQGLYGYRIILDS
jgi:WD40 repeat protein